MNPEIQQHLISYIEKLEGLAKQGADFAADQIPLVLQEYILYSRAASSWKVLVGLLLSLTGFVCARYCLRYLKNNTIEAMSPEKILPQAAMAVIFSIIGMFTTCHTADACIKAWTAPRVLLIEKLNELRK